MSIKKQYLKKEGVYKITFSIDEDINRIENVRIPGDFNNWNTNCEPMKKIKEGNFTQKINLEPDRAYQFKYLINDTVWINDPEADQLVSNGYGSGEYNSLIIL